VGDQIDKNNLNESYTDFSNPRGNVAGQPISRLSAWFNKFFGVQTKGRPTEKGGRLAGDTLKSDDTFGGVPGFGVSRGIAKIPAVEYDRKRRYKEYEKMDDYPEIAAALDIYSDDGTQKTITGNIFEIECDNATIKEEVKRFLNHIRAREFIWDIVRNVCKYGDCFIENIIDLNNTKAGVQRIKVLNPNFIFRVENKYGYLKEFLQEVPDSNASFDSAQLEGGGGTGKFLKLSKEQIVHFRIHSSDPNFYPYGKSILQPGIRAWKSLVVMEDAMLIYRLARAPERRVFYVDIGNMPTSKAETYMERLKAKFRKEKFWDSTTGTINERYNPMAPEEDFFVPTRSNSNTKIETLPGAQNLGETDDVKYFRDKLLAALKVPKDYIVEKDNTPERKANLSQLDVKFARAVTRIQREIEIGLNNLTRRHLKLKNFPEHALKEVEVTLCPPSDMFEKRRLELDEQKTRVVQAVKGLQLFSDDHLYKNYYQMSENEIENMKSEVKEMLDAEQEMMQQDPGAIGAPPMQGGPPMGPPPEGEEDAPPGAAEAAGDETIEAEAPKAAAKV
jgi:hypothetical protein